MAAPLPCLYSNNSTGESAECSAEQQVASENLCNLLTPYHRRAAHALAANVNSLTARVGLDHLGFLTLTFPDNVRDHKEAYRRFRSFNSHYLSQSCFGDWLCVKERQRRGAWHYHLLIDCGADIRTGINWDELDAGVYKSAGPHLRGLWRELRQQLPEYGFGRNELLPIRKNGEALQLYVGKYISKNVGARSAEDQGVRLCSYSRDWPRSNAHFAWNTDNAAEWRRKVAAFAAYTGCNDLADLHRVFGARWAFHYAQIICGFDENQK